MKQPTEKSKEFYELFRTIRNEIATEDGYIIEQAIRLTFDSWERKVSNIDWTSLCNELIECLQNIRGGALTGQLTRQEITLLAKAGVERYKEVVTTIYNPLTTQDSRHVLFTTEDNVNIFEGDEYWEVSGLINKVPLTKEKLIAKHFLSSPHLTFSTEQAAQAYIDSSREQDKKAIISGSLPLSELKDLLCQVSQLIAGWNATEAEWSDWDAQVQSKVHEMQLKLENKSLVTFI